MAVKCPATYNNPQEQPLRDLLKIPQAEGMSTLILQNPKTRSQSQS